MIIYKLEFDKNLNKHVLSKRRGSLIIHKSNQMKYFNNFYSVNAKSKANSIFLSFANCLVKHEERHVIMNTN